MSLASKCQRIGVVAARVLGPRQASVKNQCPAQSRSDPDRCVDVVVRLVRFSCRLGSCRKWPRRYGDAGRPACSCRWRLAMDIHRTLAYRELAGTQRQVAGSFFGAKGLCVVAEAGAPLLAADGICVDSGCFGCGAFNFSG